MLFIENYIPLFQQNKAAGLQSNVIVTWNNGQKVGAFSAGQGGFQENNILLPKYEIINDTQNQVAAASYAVSHTIFVCDNVSGSYVVAGVTATFGTASGSGTLQCEVATGTQATGSGTNQLTGTISLAGTANTPVNGTVVAAANLTTIAAGCRVNLIFAGTVTSLANCNVNVVLQRIA